MKGRHHIVLETRHLKYEFDVRRDITIIQGDSATGKTTLIELLREYGIRGSASGISLLSDVCCSVYAGASDTWKISLSSIHDSIVFIDEGYAFIYSKDYAELIRKSDNYYVLVTRKPLRNLPYSINEIYGIRTSGRYHYPDKIYHEFYPLYQGSNLSNLNEYSVVLMVEDEKSGYQFFSRSVSTQCIAVGGNSKFYDKIRQNRLDKIIVVIADGAAFGAYLNELLEIRDIRGNLAIYLPESFEWLILKSGVISADNIDDVLGNPEEYIESSEYFSWERFFTAYLKQATKDDKIKEYHKNRLAEYYLNGQAKEKILEALPKDLLEIINASSDND